MSGKLKFNAKQFAAFKEALERGRIDRQLDEEVCLLEEALSESESDFSTKNKCEDLKLKETKKMNQSNGVHDPAGTRNDIEAGK